MQFSNTFKFFAYCFSILFTNNFIVAQIIALPEPITNQATAVLKKSKEEYIYTFFGLSNSKQSHGVHRKVFRTNMKTGESKMIGLVPDSLGRLASSASTIRNKAYVVGGYGVYQNGKEISSKQVFIFDPGSESFSKGADLPVAIDDQVQAVWRDSLLYVISGWNDSNNVQAVQIYNPATNHWKLATPLPNELTAAVFGGCGTITGDTIYILGGATFAKFYPPSRQFYKGIINPADPSKINWINAGDYPGEFRYRAVAFAKEGKVYFWGGSNETYNYNGISYQAKRPVEPNKTVLIYDIKSGLFTTKIAGTPIMDLRNEVYTSDKRWYVAGGIGPGQQLQNAIIEIQE